MYVMEPDFGKRNVIIAMMNKFAQQTSLKGFGGIEGY